MKNYTEKEISKLQDSLSMIRKAGGWSAEEFGNMIGVTKQTISNLENKKTPMSKTQYIAIRAVLDYEMAERPDDKMLISTVSMCLGDNDLSDKQKKMVTAFMEGATKTGLDQAALLTGLAALTGMAAAEAIINPFSSPLVKAVSSSWLATIIKNKR